MKIPLDCKMLRLGMRYVNARASGNLQGVIDCFERKLENENGGTRPMKDRLEKMTACPKFQCLAKNLLSIHADLSDDMTQSKIVLKFPLDYKEVLSVKELLDESHEEKGESETKIVVTDIDFHQVPSADDVIEGHPFSVTSLDLLNVAVPFSVSDAVVDLDFHPPHMADDMKAFGLQGKQNILDFSRNFLTPQKELGKPAYRLADPFEVDVTKNLVTLGFECLIQGYEGKGTDYVYFNDQKLIYELVAVRHTGSYDPNSN